MADFAPYERRWKPGQEIFTDDRSVFGSAARKQIPDCDVIHLHQIEGLLDYRDFFANAPRRRPVVWTLHDMNPFTGGCHYDGGCGRFVESCGICPELGSETAEDLSKQIWRRKHYGLDTESFVPRNRQAARAALGLDTEARVVLFAADQLGNRRKGFPQLLDALSRIPASLAPTLLTFGNGNLDGAGLRHIHLGRLDGPRLLSIAYSAADAFVMPSLQEAFGQTALESMARGTPVIAFRTGGIPEFVLDGITGLLVPVGDTERLSAAILSILSDVESWLGCPNSVESMSSRIIHWRDRRDSMWRYTKR